MGLLILRPGLQTTVQDLGRPGYAHLGISASGAADIISLKIGNLLVGNPENLAGLEITLVGPSMIFSSEAFLALTGSNFDASLDGKPVISYTGFFVSKGQILSLDQTKRGARCYLSFRGGLEVPKLLSGRTTHIMAGLGGFQGRPLKKGDKISFGVMKKLKSPLKKVDRIWVSRYLDTSRLRITKGLQSNWFNSTAWNVFLGQEFIVSDLSNRMGLRLEGDPVLSSTDNEIITEGIPLGAVQVPRGGQPIISFVEHQTTGGYPKIANVITADLCRVGQLKPGDHFRFQRVTLVEAEALRIEQELMIERLKNACA